MSDIGKPERVIAVARFGRTRTWQKKPKECLEYIVVH
jgi:hypothetical protein